jgi:hypothetical protein
LEASENNDVAMIRQQGVKMVQYPPATRHAASGGDDAGITNGIEFDGVFDLARIHSLLINALVLGGVVPVVFVKVTENLGGFDRCWAEESCTVRGWREYRKFFHEIHF